MRNDSKLTSCPSLGVIVVSSRCGCINCASASVAVICQMTNTDAVRSSVAWFDFSYVLQGQCPDLMSDQGQVPVKIHCLITMSSEISYVWNNTHILWGYNTHTRGHISNLSL